MAMRQRNLDGTDRGFNWGWLAGALVILLLLGGLVAYWTPGNQTTASSNTNASAPATTGSAPSRPATPAR